MGNLYSDTNTAPISDKFLTKTEFNSYKSSVPIVLDLNTVLADTTLTKKLLDVLSSDDRFKGSQGIQGVKGDIGSFDATNINSDVKIKNDKTFELRKTKDNNQLDRRFVIQNDNDDYAIFTDKYLVGQGSNLNLQPFGWGGNVRIGYDPNNLESLTSPRTPLSTVPGAKLAVNWDISSSGQFISNKGYQIDNVYKIQFPESRDNNGIEGALKYYDDYGTVNTQSLYYRTNTSSNDIAKFKILTNGSTLGDNLKFANKSTETNTCLAVSDGNRALTKKTCNVYDPSQHFIRNGIKTYNPYVDKCININDPTGLYLHV